MFEEAPLAEYRVVVAVAARRQADQGLDGLDRRSHAAISHRLLAIGAHQRQVMFDGVHQVRQVVAQDDPLGRAHGRHHPDLDEVADFQRPAKCFLVQRVGAAQRLRPVVDQRREHQGRLGACLQVGAAPCQRQRHRAKAVAAREVAILQRQNRRVGDVGDRAEITASPLYRQLRHRHHHQLAQRLLAGVVAGHPQAVHHLQRRY